MGEAVRLGADRRGILREVLRKMNCAMNVVAVHVRVSDPVTSMPAYAWLPLAYTWGRIEARRAGELWMRRLAVADGYAVIAIGPSDLAAKVVYQAGSEVATLKLANIVDEMASHYVDGQQVVTVY